MLNLDRLATSQNLPFTEEELSSTENSGKLFQFLLRHWKVQIPPFCHISLTPLTVCFLIKKSSAQHQSIGQTLYSFGPIGYLFVLCYNIYLSQHNNA